MLVSCPDPTLSRGKGSGDYWALPWLCRVSNLDFWMNKWLNFYDVALFHWLVRNLDLAQPRKHSMVTRTISSLWTNIHSAEVMNQHSQRRGYEPTFTAERLRTNIMSQRLRINVYSKEVTNIHIAEITKIHSTEVTNQRSQRRGYELTFLAQRLWTNIHSIHKLLIVEYYSSIYYLWHYCTIYDNIKTSSFPSNTISWERKEMELKEMLHDRVSTQNLA